MQHLEDVTLFSYLDAELDEREAAHVQVHVAGCAVCRTRLAALQATLAEVDALRDLPLARDLAPAIVAKIKAQQRPVIAPRLSPAAGWALGLQGLLVLVGLGVAVPLVAELAQASWGSTMFFAWQTVLTQTQTLVAANFSINWTSAFESLRGFVDHSQAGIQLPSLPLVVVLPVLVAVTGLWVVGNGVLLRGSGRLQRH